MAVHAMAMPKRIVVRTLETRINENGPTLGEMSPKWACLSPKISGIFHRRINERSFQN
jgi:hypothetical protein